MSLFLSVAEGWAVDFAERPFELHSFSADSVIDRLMFFAPTYENIVDEYWATLYIKGQMNARKRNLLMRYIPSMFRVRRGVDDYILETVSDLHYTSPDIYDQKIRASQGTVGGDRNVPGMPLYFCIDIYSSSLLNDGRLLSPLARHARKYYTYRIDSVMGAPNKLDYRIRFFPKSMNDQLVAGYMVVSGDVWSVREIRFSGRSEMITFTCLMKMGDVGADNEFLPVSYDVEGQFDFLGNRVTGRYTAILDYKDIRLNTHRKSKRGKKDFNLSPSFSLQCSEEAYTTDSTVFSALRPIALTEREKAVYRNHFARQDTVSVVSRPKGRDFWKKLEYWTLHDYKFNLTNVGHIRFTPFVNPLLFSYSGGNGLSYRQDFRYSRLFPDDRYLSIVPKMGYNFTRKEFYWSVNVDFDYWPRRKGAFHLSVGNGNRIYSSRVIDELRSIPDSIFDFNHIHLDYFKDLYLDFRNSIELTNGLDLSIGFSAHRRTALKKSQFVLTGNYELPPQEFLNRFRNTYTSFAPRIRLEWTPCLYYYMNGNRKINYRSDYPTITIDYERGLKGAFNSTSKYERVEFDLQHRVSLGMMRTLYYRIGGGAFTNRKELYFVDFVNLSRHNLPVGWNDEIGGVFQLLDGRWYNSSRQYLRGHLTYEAPFLIQHLLKRTRYIQNERLYVNILSMPRLRPYLEIGYGIGSHILDFGVFVGSENGKYKNIGCKFTFELFNN